MNLLNYYIRYIPLLFLFISCNLNSTKSNRPIFQNDISQIENMLRLEAPISWDIFTKYNEVIDTTKFIYLETNDSVLIATIDDIKFFNDKIFILDYKTNQLIIFDEHGKALNVIKDRGRASNEYIRLCSFDLDEEKKLIYLLDGDNGKILIYNFIGEQVDIIPLPYRYINHMIYQGEGKFFLEFGTRELSRKEKISPNLVLYDTKNLKTDTEYFHHINGDILYFLRNQKTFSSYKNQIYYWIPLGHSVYQFLDSSIQQIVDFDFKGNNPPYSIYRHTWREANKILQANKYSYMDCFYNFDDWNYFRIIKTSSILHYFYHKTNHKIYMDTSFYNYDNFPNIILPELFKVSDTELCGHISPKMYLHYIKDNNYVKLDDNPILLLYKLKK